MFIEKGQFEWAGVTVTLAVFGGAVAPGFGRGSELSGMADEDASERGAKDFHQPVLVQEMLDYLLPHDGGTYLDAQRQLQLRDAALRAAELDRVLLHPLGRVRELRRDWRLPG